MRHSLTSPFFLALTLVLAPGCVTKGRYDVLENQRRNLSQDNAALQEALKAEQEKSKKLSGEVAELQNELAGILKDKSSLEGSVAEMRLALAELQRRKAEVDARVNEYKNLLSKFQSLIDAGKLRVKIVEGRMVVELATDVLFGSGSAKLSENGIGAINEVAGVLASIPDRKFQVEGHTDNIPINTALYKSNWDLAAARAITVVKTMLEAGMPPARISAASFGDSRPIQSNATSEGRSANRRIEIVVVPDLSTLPGFEELKKVGAQKDAD